MKNLFLMVFICSAWAAAAQSDKDKTGKHSMDFPEMSRAAGISIQKFNGLNSRIAAYPQYKDLRDLAGLLQLGWFKERNQLISQFNGMAGSSMSGDRGRRSSTIRYLGIAADIGYDLIPDEKLALFPLVGLGYQFYQARFFVDHSNVDFNDVLQNTNVQNSLRPLELKNSFFNYRAGLGFAARSVKHQCSIGIQAVYTGSFKDRAWRSNDNQVLGNAPTDGLSQFYAGLVFTCHPFFMMKGHM